MTKNIEMLCTEWKEELKILENENSVSQFCNKLKCAKRGIALSIDKIKIDHNKVNVQELSDSVGRIVALLEENEDNIFIQEKILSEAMAMVDRLDLRYFAQNLVEVFQNVLKEHGDVFLRDELNVRMLAKAVSNCKFNFTLETKLFKVYELIVEYKFSNFPKCGTGKTAKDPEKAIDFAEVYRMHQNAAVRKFFPNRADILTCAIPPRRFKKVMSEIGLLKGDDMHEFRDETFAEYFFSQWLIENVEKESVQKIWLVNVMTEENFFIIRKFVNGLLESKRLTAKFSIDLLKEMEYLTNCEEVIGSNFHLLAKEGLWAIMELFFDYVNTFPVTISNSILKLDADGRNVLHIACRNGSEKGTKQLLDFAERNMSRVTMQQLLHQREKDGLSPFQLAVKQDNVLTMRSFFEHYYHKCTNKTKVSLLLEQTMFGEKPLLWATKNNRKRTFKTLFLLSEEHLDEDSFRMLLLKPDDGFGTILHAAVYKSHVSIIREILILTKSVLSKQYLKMFLFEKDDKGRTVLQAAASKYSMEVIDQVWDFASSNLSERELEEFLMETDKYKSGDSILHTAALNGDVKIAEKLCDLSKSKLNNQHLRELLLKENLEGETALHSSVKKGKLEVFNQIWYFAVRTLDARSLQNFLLKKTNDGSNVILKAAHGDNMELLNKLWNYAKNALGKDLMHTFLFGRNTRQENVFTVAVLKGNLELLMKTWGLLNNTSSIDAIEEILTQPDSRGDSVLHMSAIHRRSDVLKEILGYANSVLSMESFSNFIMKRNDRGRTCMQIAKIKGNRDFTDYLGRYATNVLSRESLSDFLDNDA